MIKCIYPIPSKRVPLPAFFIGATEAFTTYVYTTVFSGKSVEKNLRKADKSHKMFTPWRAISVNNIVKNTKVLSVFSQSLLEAFSKNKFNKTLIFSEKIRKNLEKGVLQTSQ